MADVNKGLEDSIQKAREAQAKFEEQKKKVEELKAKAEAAAKRAKEIQQRLKELQAVYKAGGSVKGGISAIVASQVGNVRAMLVVQVQKNVLAMLNKFSKECPDPKTLQRLIKTRNTLLKNVTGLRQRVQKFSTIARTLQTTATLTKVLIKVITKLSQFKGESNFRTWLYRITFNHFMQMKKHWLEDNITTFDDYGKQLDYIADSELSTLEKAELKDFIEDAKLGCMNGMLLCLDREQRLVYVLGEIFGIDHNLGSQLLEISKDNFRQKLSRARKDLYQFMNNKCGLVNSNNPCRCHKKTLGFIKAGWVDKDKLKFNTEYIRKISQVAKKKSEDLDSELETKYAMLFKDQPFQEKEHTEKLLFNILRDKNVKAIFNLN
jgi:DNA-directed RNA polymerase specialized sigma24 family protein